MPSTKTREVGDEVLTLELEEVTPSLSQSDPNSTGPASRAELGIFIDPVHRHLRVQARNQRRAARTARFLHKLWTQVRQENVCSCESQRPTVAFEVGSPWRCAAETPAELNEPNGEDNDSRPKEATQ